MLGWADNPFSTARRPIEARVWSILDVVVTTMNTCILYMGAAYVLSASRKTLAGSNVYLKSILVQY